MISISPSGHVIRHTKRKARDLNPHPVDGSTRLAKRPGQPYPATFHISVDPPRIELGSPATPGWCRPVGPSARMYRVDRTGVEPRLPGLARVSRPPLGPCEPVVIERSVRELNRVFLLTEEVCCQNTYRPFRISDPGWNRTITFLVVTQASLPLDHGIVFLSVTEVGLEPTGTRLSTSPLCQFAYPVISGGSGSCTRRSRLMRPG